MLCMIETEYFVGYKRWIEKNGDDFAAIIYDNLMVSTRYTWSETATVLEFNEGRDKLKQQFEIHSRPALICFIKAMVHNLQALQIEWIEGTRGVKADLNKPFEWSCPVLFDDKGFMLLGLKSSPPSGPAPF